MPRARSYTYAQLADGIRRVAVGLSRRGFGKGDVLAIYSPNLPEYALAFFGVAMVGGIVTTANPLATAEELAAQLRDAGAIYLVTVPPFLEKALEAAGQSSVREVFVFGEAEGATPFAALLAEDGPLPEVQIDPREDVVVLPYSSGTTGLPKGVMLTHYNLVANLRQMDSAAPIAEDDVLIAVLPFYHIYGMVVLMSLGLCSGATVVSLPRFDLEQFLQTLERYAVTRAFLVPPIMLALAKHPLVDQYDLSKIVGILSAAAPLGRDVAEALRRPSRLHRQAGVRDDRGQPLHPHRSRRAEPARGGRADDPEHRMHDRQRRDRRRCRTGRARRGLGARAAGHEGVPQSARGDGGDRRRATAGSTPATSARWTRTVTCTSSTGSRS